MSNDDAIEKVTNGLKGAYGMESPEQVQRFYSGWAEGYEDELAENGYITPERCAKALKETATLPDAPMMDLGCGTGLSGLALKAQGFTCIDGFDLSPGMLEKARAKTGLYRELSLCDMSQALEMPEGVYQNAAAIGCITPDYMPVTVIDEILAKLPKGGCFVFSINDYSAQDGTIERHINEICDCWVAEMAFKEYGDHIPGTELGCTVYVLRKC
ncbi:methyltransferase domain-containing protein [Rhodobacteraceae bacterium NNCM2]|nr:methyltransferase domain-containing protein [Coraliihabitans acroporae]